MNIVDVRAGMAQRLAALSKSVQILVIVIVCICAAILLLWLFNQIFYYFLARSYVDQIADAYDLNRGFTAALVWVSFAVIVALAGWAFSFSKRRRMIGQAGIVALLIAHSITIGMVDRNFTREGSEKCYVLSRDSVKVMNRIGVDPESGRECRPLTPLMAEKIHQYKNGKRPTRVTANAPSFFSEISGEPVVWYAKNSSGAIELFDLMGYHPQTSKELFPVDSQIVDAWKVQNDKTAKRVPVRVDPNTYAFFDPMTGAAKVWYWRESNIYEFYDGPGFQPRTGEPLEVISREAISDWKKTVEAVAAKKKAEQEQRDQEARERADREAREKQANIEASQRAREAEIAATRAKLQAANDCDRLATNPTDSRRVADGVPFDMLKMQADEAFDACTRAVQQNPNEQRYMYQLGRSAQFKDRKRAFEIFTALTNERYPAAFDNLGGMVLYDRKDLNGAIKIFTIGASLGDADSMVSLADLVDKGYYGQQDPYQIKWTLLNKAAELNHSGAQRAAAAEKAKAANVQLEQENQREAARNAAAIFGTIIGNIGRR
jgi:hypothetical protein